MEQMQPINTGRVHITKSLCISQLIHCLSIIPTPADKYLEEINRTIFDYIWKGGRDCIKRKILIGPYDLGGINMPDIHTLSKSLLLKWIQRLFDETDNTWKDLLKHNLPPVDLNHLFECNLHVKNIGDIYGGDRESVWYYVLKAWCKYNYQPLPESKVDLINQTLFFNSKITIDCKTVFRRNWYQKGIFYILDLLAADCKNFLTLEEFNTKYQLTEHFFIYYQTLHSIPIEWRRAIKCEEAQKGDYVHNIKTFLGLKHKDIYEALVLRKCEIPSDRYQKWLEELQVRINKLDITDWTESYNSLRTKNSEALNIILEGEIS